MGVVLVVGPPGNLSVLKPKQPQKYNLSKPWDASLPLQQFMAANNYEPSMFQALLCWPWGAPINDHVLQLLPCLKLVVTTSTGTDHIDLRECHRRVTNLTFQLRGKRVGIVGLGSIGMKVAKRLEAFGCIILYHSRNRKPFISYPFCSNMVELAAASDVLVLCCPLNEKTRHMVNKEVMLALGNKGVIVNVARGPVIDEKELVKCLMEGEIGGAGLDVFENEPNVPQELLAMDNVILSPHSASFTTETCMAMAKLVAKNLEAFFSNKPLITQVRLD